MFHASREWEREVRNVDLKTELEPLVRDVKILMDSLASCRMGGKKSALETSEIEGTWKS